MTANRTLLACKYARVVRAYAEAAGCPLDEALKVFYNSRTYRMMRDGIADMHCMSEQYLVQEIKEENMSDE